MESGVSIIVGFHSVIFEYIAVCRIQISSRRELIFKSFSYICYQNGQEEKAYVQSIPHVDVDQPAIQK